jgi:single-strand DNA-binding protein
MTQITVVGNCARDPELRYTPNGTSVAKFSLAVNRRRKQGDEWVDDGCDWYQVTAWRDLAHNVCESIEKGTRVVVTGRVSHRQWEDQDGAKRLSIEINADDIGPSLRWATATINRNERGASATAPADGWSGGQRTVTNQPPAAYDPSEEPF